MSFKIRPYKVSDREALRQIAFDTALMGESGSVFFDGEEFLKDALTAYFTEHEPQSIWVAEQDGSLVGYITGAKDEAVFRQVFTTKVVPGLLVEFLRSGIMLKMKNWKLLMGLAQGLLTGEFKMPEFYNDYPAILHINLKEHLRGTGAGTALMGALIKDFTAQGVKAVRLATMSDKAAGFFRRNGFALLFQGQRTYLHDAVGRAVPLYVFGKKLR